MADSFWVIERFEDGRSQGYWAGDYSQHYLSDIEKAIQFRRKDDAFRVARTWFCLNTVKITEHMYMDPLPDQYGRCELCGNQMPGPHRELCERYADQSGNEPEPSPELPDSMPIIDYGNTLGRPATGATLSNQPGVALEVEEVLKNAQKAVRPIVEHERQGEEITREIMEFRMKGMTVQETFEFLLSRHQRLLEIEAATPAPDLPSVEEIAKAIKDNVRGLPTYECDLAASAVLDHLRKKGE